MYVWGGDELGLPQVHSSNKKRTFTSKIKIFHLPSGQWNVKTTSGTPPLGVIGYSCTAVGEKIYYFGGFCGHDDCFHNSRQWIRYSQSYLGNSYNLQIIIYL